MDMIDFETPKTVKGHLKHLERVAKMHHKITGGNIFDEIANASPEYLNYVPLLGPFLAKADQALLEELDPYRKNPQYASRTHSYTTIADPISATDINDPKLQEYISSGYMTQAQAKRLVKKNTSTVDKEGHRVPKGGRVRRTKKIDRHKRAVEGGGSGDMSILPYYSEDDEITVPYGMEYRI